MAQVKRFKIFHILLEQKRYFFLALLIFLSIQFYWTYLGKKAFRFARPTAETWTFERIKQKDFKESGSFSWVGANLDDVSDWKQLFNPQTQDYDVHRENGGDGIRVNGTTSARNDSTVRSPLPDAEKLRSKSDGRDVAGLLIDETSNMATPGVINVAIGSGLTTAKVLDLKEWNLHEKMQLFKSFLPSFCQTVSVRNTGKSDFNFHFYFAYDYTDKVLDGLVRDGGFYRVFRAVVDMHCPKFLPTYLHFVQCDHMHRPAWAQNDAMLEAYLDNVDYFYRINDDTVMKSNNWTEIFVNVLRKYDPPNVGVVGPSHSGGNMAILTYDFVHKTHVDVFGFYYPRLFTDWWGDDWVTKVYLPERMTKVKDIFLQHTLALGQRYSVKDWGVAKKLQKQLERDMITLKRYVRLSKKISKQRTSPDPSRVISMSLYSSKPRHSWGAIRNAQLARVIFPGWKLRFYVSRYALDPSKTTSVDDIVDLHDHVANVSSTGVSRRLLKRLQLLGAEIKVVNNLAMPDVQPINWRNLAIMDDGVEWVLARNVDARLTESEARGVERWIENFRSRLDIDAETLSLASITDFLGSFVGIYEPNSKKPAALHVLRDLPESVLETFPGGTWGGNARLLRLLLDDSLQSIVGKNQSVGTDAGKSAKIRQKFESLKVGNPYLSPGVEELVRVWSTKDPDRSGTDSSSSVLMQHLASRLTVERLDHVTCLQEDDPSFEHSFAGQRFDEHEMPYPNNDVSKEPVFEDMDRVSPSFLCKTIDNVVLRPSTGNPTKATTTTAKKTVATTRMATTTTTTTTTTTKSSATTNATKPPSPK